MQSPFQRQTPPSRSRLLPDDSTTRNQLQQISTLTDENEKLKMSNLEREIEVDEWRFKYHQSLESANLESLTTARAYLFEDEEEDEEEDEDEDEDEDKDEDEVENKNEEEHSNNNNNADENNNENENSTELRALNATIVGKESLIKTIRSSHEKFSQMKLLYQKRVMDLEKARGLAVGERDIMLTEMNKFSNISTKDGVVFGKLKAKLKNKEAEIARLAKERSEVSE